MAGKKKSRYNQKLVKTSESAAGRLLKRTRNILIFLYLIICVAAGFAFYHFYSGKKMSDVPEVAIERTEENTVSTGNELLTGVPFGPWDGK